MSAAADMRAFSHAGRKALVTGGAGGIGWATAVQLAQAGAEVAICDREGPALDGIAQRIAEAGLEGRVRSFAADVTDRAAIARMMGEVATEFSALDYVVNNAGIGGFADMENFSEEAWHRTIDVNLLSIFLVTSAALPLMKKAGGGAVVNVASIHSHITTAGRPDYTASKAGVSGATRALAIDLGAHGIRVNAVSPGVIRTPMLVESWDNNSDIPFDELETRAARLHPVGRIGEADDVASAIVFLLDGDRAGFITGTDLLVDGGIRTRLAVATIWND